MKNNNDETIKIFSIEYCSGGWTLRRLSIFLFNKELVIPLQQDTYIKNLKKHPEAYKAHKLYKKKAISGLEYNEILKKYGLYLDV